MESEDPMVPAKKVKEMLEEQLHRTFTLSKVVRLMTSGQIPSEKSLIDARQRVARRSAVQAWIERAKAQGGRPALAFV